MTPRTSAALLQGPEDMNYVSETAKKYQELIVELAARPEFHSDIFTVEVQPFFIDTYPPTLVRALVCPMIH